MNRWWLSSLCAFSLGLLLGQKFFGATSHGQRSPTAYGSSLLDLKEAQKQKNQKAPKPLSEQMPLLADNNLSADQEKSPENSVNESIPVQAASQNVVSAVEGKGTTGFLDKLKDIPCCSEGHLSDSSLAKLDLALDQTCSSLEKTCLEALWAEVVSIHDLDLMRASAERFMVRYANVDAAFVLQKATELSVKDPYNLDAYAFSNALSIYYSQSSKEALDFFFGNQKSWGARASEFAKMFLSNEVVQSQENLSVLLNELQQFALTNELASKMRKRVFLDWYDKDPETASGYAESQAQDGSLLEVLNMKRQISSLKNRLSARSPASENDPVTAEIQSQITLIENQIATLSSF